MKVVKQEPEQQFLSRREALKALAAASGATALSSLPARWEKPTIEVGALPAFAQLSPTSFPFTNNVDVQVLENGAPSDNFTWFEDQGWVGVYASNDIQVQDAGGKKPWRRLRRRQNAGPPFWAAGPLVVQLTLTFSNQNQPDALPTGNVFCYGYGRFGGSIFFGLIQATIANGQVVFLFPLPVGFIGFFFFSCFFPTVIVLENGAELDTSFYCGPCLYGFKSDCADDDDEDDIDDDAEGVDDPVDLGQFKITFLGATINDNSSTWRYNVMDNPTPPPNLAKWVLELPLNCATVDDPDGGTVVNPDPDTNLSGLAWTNPVTGDFEITLSGNLAVGIVGVAVQDSNGAVIPGLIAGPICVEDKVILPNCYQINFLGATNNGDGTSTWQYQVIELDCAQDLSNWVLALPFACGTSIVDASPDPWEEVTPDPNANLDGIKWQTGAGFQQGVFEVILQGEVGVELKIGVVDVAAKGPDVAFGQISGPVCP